VQQARWHRTSKHCSGRGLCLVLLGLLHVVCSCMSSCSNCCASDHLAML
jgi:hypothetical protein